MKYEVGDKVLVRSDLPCKGYLPDNPCYVNEDMGGFRGKVVEIKAIDKPNKRYILEEPMDWRWTEDMFDGLATPFKKGDKVMCIDAGNYTTLLNGTVYTVEAVFHTPVSRSCTPNDPYVMFDKNSLRVYRSSRFAKYEEPQPTPCKFKVGDKVTPKETDWGLKKGVVYTVRKTAQLATPRNTKHKPHWSISLEEVDAKFFYGEGRFELATVYSDKDYWFTKKLVEGASNRMEQQLIAGSTLGGMLLKSGDLYTPRKQDMVNRPDHYTQGDIECIDAIDAAIKGLPATYAFLTGQVLKYMWRWYWKGKPIEDLEKAKFYLERLISKVKETK